VVKVIDYELWPGVVVGEEKLHWRMGGRKYEELDNTKRDGGGSRVQEEV
jgi:hypothetical protein